MTHISVRSHNHTKRQQRSEQREKAIEAACSKLLAHRCNTCSYRDYASFGVGNDSLRAACAHPYPERLAKKIAKDGNLPVIVRHCTEYCSTMKEQVQGIRKVLEVVK